MSPPIMHPIPNHDKNTLELPKYKCLPLYVPPLPPGFKLLRNEANDDNSVTIYTSRTDKDDTSLTNQDDYIENVKAMKKKMIMTNTKKIIHNINTVMKVLSTKPKKNKHQLNG